MEKSSSIYTIPGSFGWSDVGTWGSVLQNSVKDAGGNAVVGPDVDLYDCEGCVVHIGDLKKVVIEGLEGYIVAEKNGKLLVCRLSSEQKIRDFQK
jgi:mannose-1-phosphate guanylyltransferase